MQSFWPCIVCASLAVHKCSNLVLVVFFGHGPQQHHYKHVGALPEHRLSLLAVSGSAIWTRRGFMKLTLAAEKRKPFELYAHPHGSLLFMCIYCPLCDLSFVAHSSSRNLVSSSWLPLKACEV
eukprot:4753959-Amphidinium_carterae.1